MRYPILFFALTITSVLAANQATSPRGGELFKKKKVLVKPALPPLPPGFQQTTIDTNLHMTSIKKTNVTSMHIAWSGPTGTVFQLLTKTNVLQSQWANVGSETTNRSTTVPINTKFSIFEVKSAGPPPPTPGTLQWLSAQTNSVGLGNSIKVDHAGNSIVTGQFQGTANFGGGPITSAGALDIFIAKYNPQGGLIWAKAFGGNQDDGGYSVGIDSLNNIIVSGYYSTTSNFGGISITSNGANDMFVAKYSPAGNLIWVKGFGAQANDAGRSVIVDKNDNILLAGWFSFTVNFGGIIISIPHGTEIALVKLSSTGTVLWAKGWGDPGTGQCDTYPRDMAVNSSGDVFVIGDFSMPTDLGGGVLPAAGYNFFTAKYSGVDGSYRWAKYTGSDDKNQGRGIAVDPTTGNVITTGTIQGTVNPGCGTIIVTYPTMFLAAYNSTSGNCIWVQNYQTLDSFSSGWGGAVTVDIDGTVALSGQIKGGVLMAPNVALSGGGNLNFMIATFSMSGNSLPVYRWGKALGGSGESGGNSVSFDPSGHVLTTGVFKLTKDFGGIIATGASLGSAFEASYTK